MIPAGPCSIEFAGNLGATNGNGGGRRGKLTAAQVDSGRRAAVFQLCFGTKYVNPNGTTFAPDVSVQTPSLPSNTPTASGPSWSANMEGGC